MYFDAALSLMRSGKRVTRKSWAKCRPVSTYISLSSDDDGEFIQQCDSTGERRVWHVYHVDLLSDDWRLYEERSNDADKQL